jgi:hypothetical protein
MYILNTDYLQCSHHAAACNSAEVQTSHPPNLNLPKRDSFPVGLRVPPRSIGWRAITARAYGVQVAAALSFLRVANGCRAGWWTCSRELRRFRDPTSRRDACRRTARMFEIRSSAAWSKQVPQLSRSSLSGVEPKQLSSKAPSSRSSFSSVLIQVRQNRKPAGFLQRAFSTPAAVHTSLA